LTEEQIKLTMGCLLYPWFSDMLGQEPDERMKCLIRRGEQVAERADGRGTAESFGGEDGIFPKTYLASIFNELNGNRKELFYNRRILSEPGYGYEPTAEPKSEEGFAAKVRERIRGHMGEQSLTDHFVNSLLAILEECLSFTPVPRGDAAREVSFYDHLKIRAAAALCIERYIKGQGLAEDAPLSEREETFLLYSMDISGIQSFLYTVGSKGALKGLRARSFYLELLMEHVIDELLEALSLARTNLIYAGGGHCYLLLPNTERTKHVLEEQERCVNEWLRDRFGTALYVAGGYAACSVENLRDEPAGSYAGLYRTISRMISGRKAHRYTAADISSLNRSAPSGANGRECVICRRTGAVDSDGRCAVCGALYKMSDNILYKDIYIVRREAAEDALPLPGGKYLVSAAPEEADGEIRKASFVRCYTKNRLYAGIHGATRLWVGDYTAGVTFEDFAENAEGISRIGILRADVDNLGNTFVNGFQGATLAKSAALSRQLSLFFKYHINGLLEDGRAAHFKKAGKRNVTIVYAGGDDIFLAGQWNDVLEAFIDLRTALREYSIGSLSISGGLGLYRPHYPISAMALETAELEECSKGMDGKDAVTLFEEDGCYSWTVFCQRVLEEKFQVLRRFFDGTDEYGRGFLYRILELLRNREEPVNRARYVYLLSRMEPGENSTEELRSAYRAFAEKMYRWIRNEEDRREVVTAIYLYVYLRREDIGG